MEKSPKSQSTLRQALARQWQVPLFVVSVIAFGTSLVMLRPETIEPTFDEEFVVVSQLAAENRYTEFYGQAEQLRVKSITQAQLGRVHGLVAQTRAQELNQRREFSLNASNPRSTRRNYGNIITDYREAIERDWVDPNSPAAKDVFQDMALAYWGLDDAPHAINYQKKAISVSETFDPVLHRGLVEMYLSARPKEYLTISLGELEKILGSPNTNADDKAWAFARKAEVLIGQGHENEALVWLNTADDLVKASRYAEEVDFLRGRAMRHSGQADQAELVLRDLLARMADRGDVYAQVALELGKINYEQYRDYDARNFYKIVVDSQVGKEWYVAGRLGLAECDAMQQRYDQAAMHYQAVVDLIKERPNNRSVGKRQAQKSLAVLAHKLGLLKQYDLGIAFLELEQQMALPKDRDAVSRYAMMLRRMAESLFEQIGQAKKDSKQANSVSQDDPWFAQQNQLKVDYYVRAAQQFLRLADLTVENAKVYSDSLWSAAMCYDRAGEALNTITTLKRYVDEHVGQTEWTDALYYLAQAHQSVGHFEEAINYYSTLRNRHPNMPAAINSIIPMARCYLSLEPPVKEKAEKLLQAVLSDPAMTPRAPKFHEAMIELGKLYYDSERYDEAIPLLKEAIDRNPGNPALGEWLFLVGDSYRKSGLIVEGRLAELARDPTGSIAYEETLEVRQKNMAMAEGYFRQAIDFLDAKPKRSLSRLEKLNLRHCCLYRGDCLYDLGRYEKAVEVYENAALRYKVTPTALEAFVQIINCHLQLGNARMASSANKRAVWQLNKISDDVLTESAVGRTREEWLEWFTWTDQAGLWDLKKEGAGGLPMASNK